MPKQQRPAPPPKLCVYCGSPATSRDHVIPKSLFTPPLPQMITVPSCDECQEEKGYGDDDLAHFVALDVAGSRHPEAIAQMLRAASATNQGYSKIGQAFSGPGQVTDVFTDSGIWVQEVWETPIPNDNRDMFRTLEYIVRGLHVVRNFRYDRRIPPLPVDWLVEVKGVHFLKAREIALRFTQLPHSPIVAMRNNIAWWTRILSPEDSMTSLWLLVFNDEVCFVGATGDFVLRARELGAQG